MSTEFLSLVVAILAVIIGPTVSFFIAKKQLRAQIIYASNLDDLKLLRNTLLDLLKTYSQIAFLINQKIIGGVSREEFNERHQPLFTELMLYADKISLLIDKENQLHIDMLSEIHKIAEVLLNDSNPNWQEDSIKHSGKIAASAIKVLDGKKKEIEKKF